MVTGSTIMPLSERLTLSTSPDWTSIGRFLWTIPMPPSCAMAIARRESVTVSMAAETRGMFSRMLRVSWVDTSTLLGSTSERAGSRSTSSNVSASGMGPSSMLCSSVTGERGRPPAILYPHPVGRGRTRRGPGPLLRAVALLVFLSRAARAGVVPAHPAGLALRGLRRLLGGRGVGQVALPPDPHLPLLGRHLRVHAPEVHDDLVLDPLLHQAEHGEGLLLVLGERVALAVAAQPDPLLEVVHRQQVVLPGGVDDVQHQGALVLAHRLFAKGALLLFVAPHHLCLEPLAQVHGVDRLPVDARGLHVDPEVAQQPVAQL